MAREIVSISLSPGMRRYIDRDIKASGFSSVSEYFRELIRQRRQQRMIEKDQAAALLRYREKKGQLELMGYRPPDARCMCSRERDSKGRFRYSPD